MSQFVLVCDGGTRLHNPGIMYGSWKVLIRPYNKVIAEGHHDYGLGTSNSAEYHALISGLDGVKELGICDIEVWSDSEVVVGQVSQGWKVNHAHLRTLNSQVRSILSGFRKVKLTWRPREIIFKVLGH